jgi:hypothetical protein
MNDLDWNYEILYWFYWFYYYYLITIIISIVFSVQKKPKLFTNEPKKETKIINWK